MEPYICLMIRKLFHVLGLILSVLFGWALGYIRVPYVQSDHSFWVGFVGGLGLFVLIAALLFIWNKIIRTSLVGPYTTINDAKHRWYSFIWVSSILIFIGVITFGGITYNQNKAYQAQIRNQQIRIKEQVQTIDSLRQSKLMIVMRNLLDAVDKEVHNHPSRALSDETIARVVALGAAFKPYKYTEDSIPAKKLSPERGQLLLALSNIKMDSSSFSKIKNKISFAEADLRKANLKGIDLSGVDLSKANLQDAILIEANLKNSNLKKANLNRTNFDRAELSGADIKRATMRWAELNDANLEKANLDGADLSNAKLRKANLRAASVRWVDLTGGFLNESNLIASDLARSVLVKTNLTNARLIDAYLKGVDFKDAILGGTIVNRDWLETIQDKKLEVVDVEDVIAQYTLSADTLDENGLPEYRLEQVLH